MNQYKGECLCGACRYVIRGDKPVAAYFCHCSRCRKETGTIHAATVFFNNAQLVWERGAANLTHYRLEHTRKQRVFCTTCGCPLPRKEGELQVVLPAGTLDEGINLEPTAHIFYKDRVSWEDSLSNLTCFEGLPMG